MRRDRLLVVIDGMEVGGSQRQVQHLLASLDRQRWEPELAFFRCDSFLADAIRRDGIVVHYLPKRRRITTLHGHTGAVVDAAWTPDGELLLTAGDDGFVRVWNAEAGKALAAVALAGSSSALAIAPDGGRVAVLGVNGTIRVLPLRLESRTPEQIAAIVERNVPWVVDDSGRLVAR